MFNISFIDVLPDLSGLVLLQSTIVTGIVIDSKLLVAVNLGHFWPRSFGILTREVDTKTNFFTVIYVSRVAAYGPM